MLPKNTKKVNSESANSCRKYCSLINLFHKWFDYSAVENALTGNHGTLSRLLFIGVRWCVSSMKRIHTYLRTTEQKNIFICFFFFFLCDMTKLTKRTMLSTFKISKKVYPEKLVNCQWKTLSYQKSWANFLKTWWYSQIQNFDWVNQRKVINAELIRPLLKTKGIGLPKSPRVSDFHPKSGKFWYFLACPLLCRLRLPSGANASAKILLILH